ncbi:hypothetical protein [Methylobacterium brachiatum]|uniref:hypothetical protein n=1 Tax=Methylobacterium brachiatum TaxID=269660 RepID=UPI00244BD7EC|nr:hypothetical protein [Methylobacterium brachiatum]MDH2314056.1 hypothetical protein [Methylobacterium brachiatum]
MPEQYIICRPDAGLTDMLTQIEMTHRYAEQTNRIVVVDTDYKHSFFFRDNFSKYFTSKDDRLTLDISHILKPIDEMTTFPSVLSGRASSYKPLWSDTIGNWVDAETYIQLSFDMRKKYNENILIHHQCGGNQSALFALTKLTVREEILDLLAERIDAIGSPFSAIHIRNTDYKTNYRAAVDLLKNSITFPVFIATDNLECRNYCISAFGERNVRFFSCLPDDGKPIHLNHSFSSLFSRNADSILDLLTLALSSKFYKINLDGSLHGTQFSGYSILAENLITYDGILVSLLGTSSRAKSILQRAFTWRKSAR